MSDRKDMTVKNVFVYSDKGAGTRSVVTTIQALQRSLVSVEVWFHRGMWTPAVQHAASIIIACCMLQTFILATTGAQHAKH
jgi:hypothetical protein